MVLPTQQTFGIELEFIIFYTTTEFPVPSDHVKRYGPILERPSLYRITPPEGGYGGEDPDPIWVRQQVADVITSAGFKARALTRLGPAEESFDAWNVVPDQSVELPIDLTHAYYPLKHVGVEINSPVFVDAETAFEEIRAVVVAINESFRTAVPPCCGFHVHVGYGGVPLKLRPVQRIASLLFVAESLLDTIHASSRLGNSYCLGTRQISESYKTRKSNGSGGSQQSEAEHKALQHAELSWEEVDKKRTKPTYGYWSGLRRIGSNENPPSRALANEYWSHRQPDAHLTRREIRNRVRKILRATDTSSVAKLMSPGSTRGAYNFANLARKPSSPDPDSTPTPATAKPTIEFRQAAGTLDEDWIVVWCKICLALCGPGVVESSDNDFFQLLYDCIKSEKWSSKYNLFDLLHDIGVQQEDIRTVEERLVSGRHEREVVLPFHRPDDRPNGVLDESIGVTWHRPSWLNAHGDRYEKEDEDESDGDEEEESDGWSDGCCSPNVEIVDLPDQTSHRANEWEMPEEHIEGTSC